MAYVEVQSGEIGDGKVGMVMVCRWCHKEITLIVTQEGYDAWNQGRGVFVQVAFPELTPAERELMISGTCGQCWNDIMGPEPD
jgi:hypothetical protein